MSDHNDIYLRPREAAEFLRTSTSTLAKRRLNGEVQSIVESGVQFDI
jgi:hypothetical protein